MKSRRAFTLIELMIVVAVFAVISAILVPMMIRTRQQALKQAAAREAARQADLPVVAAPPKVARGPLAELRSLQLDIKLASRVQRSGVDVATPYQAKVAGTLSWASPLKAGDPRLVQVIIPFPSEEAVVSEVHCQLKLGGRVLPEEQLHSEKDGLTWTGSIPPDQELEATFEYSSSGQDVLLLPLSGNGRMRQFQVHLDRKESQLAEVPSSALQPTSLSADEIVWDYKNLVSDRSLEVELPTNTTNEARTLTLCRLVGLAVLLYGLGFWYLGELHQPGRLARFNWANFFLLALTYSFFFPALAVFSLGLGWSLAASIGGAALLSLPLLTIHVARIVDLRFALSNLLLAALTLIVVVSGVFGEQLKLPVYLGASFLCVGFVTLTYARWSSHRELWQRQGEDEWLESLKARQQEQLEARQLVAEALAMPVELAERELLEKSCQGVQETLRRCDDTYSRAITLSRQTWDSSRREMFQTLRETSQQQASTLSTCLELLRRQMQRQPKPVAKTQDACHCLDCGQSAPSSRCCPHCGALRPLQLHCRCGQNMVWPLAHLNNPATVPHCTGCGSKHSFK